MTLATSLQKAVQNAMKSLGGAVTVQTVSGGVYDTVTGQISETISGNEIKGVLQGVSAREVNELIQSSDKRLIRGRCLLKQTTSRMKAVCIISVLLVRQGGGLVMS